MGISFRTSGSTRNIERFLHSMQVMDLRRMLEPYAQQGVTALAAATPTESGLAAHSWYYEITSDRDSVTITWRNRDVETGFPVAIALQYGYATGTGGWVEGRDYINPAIQPTFDRLADAIWRVVTSA